MTTLTFDVPVDQLPPEPGEWLRPRPPAVAWYEVLSLRPVESRVNPNRWRIEVRRINPKVDVPEDGTRLTWYERVPAR